MVARIKRPSSTWKVTQTMDGKTRPVNRGKLLAVFTVGLAMTLSLLAVGQTQSIDKLKSQVKELVDDPKLQFLARLKLTDQLRQRDIKLAIQNAKAVEKLAVDIGDEDLITTAKLDIRVLMSLARGTNQKRTLNSQLFDLKLHENGDPDLRIHCGLALLELQSSLHEPNRHASKILDYIDAAAQQCKDPELLLQRCCSELYFRIFRCSEPLSDPVVQDLLRTMMSFISYDGYPDAAIYEILFESRAASKIGDENHQLVKIKEAAVLATKNENRFLQVYCMISESIITRDSVNHRERMARLRGGLQVATQLGSLDVLHHFLNTQSRLTREMGDPFASIEYLELVSSLPTFPNATPFTQNFILGSLVQQSSWLGHEKKAEEFRQQMIPQHVVDQLDEYDEFFDELADKNDVVVEENRIKDNLLVVADEKSRRQEASVSFFQKYSLITTALILVAIPWLLLYLIRNHLKKVEYELASEKIVSLEHRKNYNDLALRLQRVQRMESLGLMAGSVAHDFNNILVGVLGNAEIIRLKNDLGDKQFVHQRVDSIIKSAEKAAKLSKQMLAYAGKQIIAKQIAEINSLVQQFQSVLESACFEEQTLVVELFSEPICAKVDPTQIEQILLNLITNAVEASSKSGVITIRSGKQFIDQVEDDPSLFGSRTAGGEMGFVEVLDEGIGISQKELERIFEPFYSNSENMGRGLGLSVVYGAVEGHDGLIQCRSALGKGTSFKILFPLESVEALHAQSEASVVTEFHSMLGVEESLRGKTVLIIDDESSVLDLCKHLVSLNGFNVVTANGGKRGIEQILAHQEVIDCILLDVVMPEMGGNEVLREIESLNIDTPVVLMSGFSQTKLESFLQRPNVERIIQKPFRAVEIKHAVQDCVELSISRKKDLPVHTASPK